MYNGKFFLLTQNFLLHIFQLKLLDLKLEISQSKYTFESIFMLRSKIYYWNITIALS